MQSDTPSPDKKQQALYQQPLIRGLFEALPPVGTPWPQERRMAWFDLAACIFAVLYQETPSRRIDWDDVYE
jgi:hypothetical protein